MRPHNIEDYSFLSAEQIRRLAEIQNTTRGLGLHVLFIRECGCIKVHHSLLSDTEVQFDKNGNEVR